ncbi:STAS domain-containing protein [Rathayibacter iranicus]|uniref:Anti-sigma factor antagonist n=2 Tax=Rathayibacter iranicus TaxID=59737 RepID=A0AAD1EN89_9MICO|nr:STAS domain-containing protein [Rathayibacter iranicus]AZZ56893.1 anti-sigma factor antagonist [Rathayibacter iranicus]MWV29492.1 anti-sigma factor antagonist [Rathayibacter iranicus NCPPB 2253 = VKM Ac-1602]PPI42406.1 anti-anti-sigma factor [Rathayibacter iranicus]PPI57828.1 anti-anti-sigma factor [Rathayibacter iranicus]PPI68766.1 anti-anti-sigma factor [Rathayibacter iranicus]
MTITTETIEPDITILNVGDRLTASSAQELRAAVRRAVDAGSPRIVVELSEVRVMDSSGLGALVSALKIARQAGGDLRIASPSRQVAMALTLSNLDRLLVGFDCAAAAYRE